MPLHIRDVNIHVTLRICLELLDKDVKNIQKVQGGKESRWKKLDKLDRETIVEYIKVLNTLISDEDKLLHAAKKKYSKIETDELMKLVADRTKKK